MPFRARRFDVATNLPSSWRVAAMEIDPDMALSGTCASPIYFSL